MVPLPLVHLSLMRPLPLGFLPRRTKRPKRTAPAQQGTAEATRRADGGENAMNSSRLGFGQRYPGEEDSLACLTLNVSGLWPVTYFIRLYQPVVPAPEG